LEPPVTHNPTHPPALKVLNAAELQLHWLLEKEKLQAFAKLNLKLNGKMLMTTCIISHALHSLPLVPTRWLSVLELFLLPHS
tara:strand:- start:183 stop:428 length:246 start_codon:yes stop_codon:yes gene_type:complete